MPRKKSVHTFDAMIAGGGLAGLTLAARLGGGGFSVAVIERESRERLASPAYDGRTTALAYGSTLTLRACGVWEKIKKDCCPIDDIRVADQHAFSTLDFDSRDASDNPFGYIIENTKLREALFARVIELKNVTLFCPAKIEAISENEHAAAVRLDDGKKLQAPLLIGADGRRSTVREHTGIAVRDWSYDETALICTISHANPHHNLALEHFYPGGPFAVLPMAGNRSAIVWTEKPGTAAALRTMPEDEFRALLKERGCEQLGELKLLSERQLYPLRFMLADELHAGRIVLIGEAAHAMHPIAGQGFNLTMRDIATLGAKLEAAKGSDLGSAALLEAYASARHFDHFTFMAATDMLVKLFSNNFGPLKAARRFGLALVGKLPPAKEFFSRMAMGLLT
jgi:2-octaprenyl-6-methoxyphenol hydroxylase